MRGAFKYVLLLTGFFITVVILDILNAHNFWNIALMLVAIVIVQRWIALDFEARWNVKIPWLNEKETWSSDKEKKE